MVPDLLDPLEGFLLFSFPCELNSLFQQLDNPLVTKARKLPRKLLSSLTIVGLFMVAIVVALAGFTLMPP